LTIPSRLGRPSGLALIHRLLGSLWLDTEKATASAAELASPDMPGDIVLTRVTSFVLRLTIKSSGRPSSLKADKSKRL
jgi:hypothetical protein